MEGDREKSHIEGLDLKIMGGLFAFTSLFFALAAAAGFKEPDARSYLSSLVPGGTARDLALVLSGMTLGMLYSGFFLFMRGRTISQKNDAPKA